MDGELKLTHTATTKTYQGDLAGQGTLRYLMFYGPDETTRVLGIERVNGTLTEKSGTFVLEHTGTDNGSEARETVRILPGSGTGQLRGITGGGETVASRDGQFTMTIDYELA